MFETTLEAQDPDGIGRRFGTISAAALAHLGVGLAVAVVAALSVGPVPVSPDPVDPVFIMIGPIPNEPPSEPSPPEAPHSAGPDQGVSPPAAAPDPIEPAPPAETPDVLPSTPPEEFTAGADGPGSPMGPPGSGIGVGGPSATPGSGGGGGGAGPGGGGAVPLSGGMERPVLLVRVEPVFPAAARHARLTGRVAVQAVIGLDGSVESAEILRSSNPLFDAASLDAVRQWRYRPVVLDGRPVRVYFTVLVEFTLR